LEVYFILAVPVAAAVDANVAVVSVSVAVAFTVDFVGAFATRGAVG